jgi:hypothetical protein
VGGVYLFEFFERLTNDSTSYGLLKFNGDKNLRTRKLGFYAYQSFTLS